MADPRPVGLPGWLLLAPVSGLGIGLVLVALSGWGTRGDGPGVALATAGSLSAMLAIFTAWVVAPVSAYSLVANSALRTPARILATGACVFVAATPLLPFLFGGI
jgi:hypothetical protein